MSVVLVGEGRGRVAPSAPRAGLRPAVVELLRELRLPGPDDAGKDIRLDPLRSALDRRREITLRRLLTCGVGYAERTDVGTPDGAPALTRRWQAAWSPSVEANLDLLTIHGITLGQAAEGRLRQAFRAEVDAGGPTAAETVAGLTAAAECGLPVLVAERLRAAAGDLVPSASLPELLAAADAVDAIRLGHVAGIDPSELAELAELAELSEQSRVPDLSELSSTLDTAAVGRLDGLRGSDDTADARTIAALATRASRVGGELRLDAALQTLEAEGSPLVAGAAAGARALIGTLPADRLGERAAGWIDGAVTTEARTALRRKLTGLLTAAEPLCASAPEVLDPLADRIESLPDDAFLARLPALRGGFTAVSPAGRDRILDAVELRIGARVRGSGRADNASPEALHAATLADRAGAAALAAAGMMIPDITLTDQAGDAAQVATAIAAPDTPTTNPPPPPPPTSTLPRKSAGASSSAATSRPSHPPPSATPPPSTSSTATATTTAKAPPTNSAEHAEGGSARIPPFASGPRSSGSCSASVSAKRCSGRRPRLDAWTPSLSSTRPRCGRPSSCFAMS
ncbi:DUF5682 family protein [Catenulispora yoronensis]